MADEAKSKEPEQKSLLRRIGEPLLKPAIALAGAGLLALAARGAQGFVGDIALESRIMGKTSAFGPKVMRIYKTGSDEVMIEHRGSYIPVDDYARTLPSSEREDFVDTAYGVAGLR